MSDYTLTLNFGEPIGRDSVDVTQLTIQNRAVSADATEARTLTSASTVAVSSNALVATISLGDADVTALQLAEALAVGGDSTFVLAKPDAFEDLWGNGNAEQVADATFEQDDISPEMKSFAINLNDASISVTFSEVVDKDTFNTSKIILQDAVTATVAVQLNGGTLISTVNGKTIITRMTVKNVNELKQQDMFTDTTNGYMRADAGLVSDMSGNAFDGIADGQAIKATSIVFDDKDPEVLSYTYAASTGRLVLTFGETIKASSVQPSEMQLQSKANAATAGAATLDLDGATVEQKDFTEITITLSANSLNSIKANEGLGTTESNTFLSFSAAALKDMRGNNVTAVLASAALKATTVTPDTDAPGLTVAGIDMSTQAMELRFSETIEITSFNFSAVTLMSTASAGAGQTRQLTGAINATRADNLFALTFYLVEPDMHYLQFHGIGTSAAAVFVALVEDAVQDMNAQPSEAVASLAVLPANFVADSNPPSVTKATFDANAAELVLTMSEPLADAVQVTAVTLLAAPGSACKFTLTAGASSATLTELNIKVTIDIGDADMNVIRDKECLAVDGDTIYVAVDAAFGNDRAAVPLAVVPITEAAPRQADTFSPDTTDPRLVAFTLNLNDGTAIFEFSETINVTSIDPALFVLQSAADAPGTAGSSSVALAGSTVTEHSSVVKAVFKFAFPVFEKLRVDDDLITDRSNTFVSVGLGGAKDMVGRALEAIPTTAALQATAVTADGSSPVLRSWTLNMSSQVAVFQFSEAILGRTFTPALVRLQPSPAVGSAGSVSLDGTVVDVNSSQVTVKFTQQSADLLKANRAFATAATAAATYAVLTSTDVGTDMAGNAITASTVGLAAASVFDDDVTPTLKRFGLNVTSGVLTLVFSEIVQTATLNTDFISLQSDSQRVSSTKYLDLDGGVVSGGLSTTAEVQLPHSFLNALKHERSLGSNDTNTYLALGAGAVLDLIDLGSELVSDQSAMLVTANEYVEDGRKPELVSYTINLDEGYIVMSWSEAVDPKTLEPGKFAISGSS